DGVPESRQKQVESVAQDADFHWLTISEKDLPAFADRDRFNRTTLFRLGLERLAPADCRRVLYLDADVLVLGDVRDVYGIDLRGAPLGGVPDPGVISEDFRQRWSLPPTDLSYFNAGVLIIDLERVRAEQLFTKAIAFVAEHDTALPFNDQDALNW